MGIKDWSLDDRPIEKFIQKGNKSCSTSEILAILIGSGSHNESALDLAKRILNDYDNSLERISKLTIAEFTKYKGIGQVKAVKIAAGLELGSRRLSETPKVKPKITSSHEAFTILHSFFHGLTREEFYVMYLSNANQVISIQQLSIGSSKATIVDVKSLAKQALDLHASTVILAHNHPSGNLVASQSDKELTEKVKNALEFFDVKLIDHLIIYENTYYSFADDGLL